MLLKAIPISILISAVLVAVTIVTTNRPGVPLKSMSANQLLPVESVVLPVKWGNLSRQMIVTGVIDDRNGEFNGENGYLKITPENAGFVLNLLWALGLSNKNDILETGPMNDSKYGDPGNFASTGGWTLAVGNAMNHYSRHPFVILTPVEQQLVERVSKNIYRPCCDNPTHFPDCNHGMAMLGLLELMASQGIGEDEMYKIALQVNSYWFPDTYLTIAQYLELKGIDWDKAEPKELLGYNFSSVSGYQQILSRITTPEKRNSSSCGV